MVSMETYSGTEEPREKVRTVPFTFPKEKIAGRAKFGLSRSGRKRKRLIITSPSLALGGVSKVVERALVLLSLRECFSEAGRKRPRHIAVLLYIFVKYSHIVGAALRKATERRDKHLRKTRERETKGEKMYHVVARPRSAGYLGSPVVISLDKHNRISIVERKWSTRPDGTASAKFGRTVSSR